MSCYNCISLLFFLMYTIVSSRLPLLSLGMMCHSSRIIARPSCRPYSYLLFTPRCPTKSQPLPMVTKSSFSDPPLVQRFSDSILYTFTRLSLDESTSMTLTDEHVRMARCQFSCPVPCCTSGNTPRIWLAVKVSYKQWASTQSSTCVSSGLSLLGNRWTARRTDTSIIDEVKFTTTFDWSLLWPSHSLPPPPPRAPHFPCIYCTSLCTWFSVF